MINDYIIDINLPVKFVPYNFLEDTNFTELSLTPDLINYEFHDWLKQLGLKVCPNNSRYMSRPPFMRGSIHVDGYGEDATKLNLIYDSFDSVMNWYELLPGKASQPLTNYQKQIIRSYHPNDCKKLLTTPSNMHCLVNAKMIHQVTVGHNNSQFRKCYSLSLLDYNNNKRIHWKEAVDIFQPYLVIRGVP